MSCRVIILSPIKLQHIILRTYFVFIVLDVKINSILPLTRNGVRNQHFEPS